MSAAACGAAPGADDVLTVQVGEMPKPAAPSSRGGSPDARALVTSYGRVAIGSTRADVLRALGKPEATLSESEERRAFESAGYVPDDELVFVVGFDESDRFGAPKDPALPVYKVFYRDDRVAMFKLSVYVLGDLELEGDADPAPSRKVDLAKIGFPPRCYLYATRADATATFGMAELLEPPDAYGNTTLHYFKRGLSVVLDAETIVAIDVYGQLSPGVEEAFRSRAAHAADGGG